LPLIISFFIFLHPAYALEFNDATFPELATSARGLAMGNAFIARVDDAASAFYNPAGLGTVRGGHFHLTNMHLESNKDWLRLTTGGKAFDAASNFAQGFNLDGMRELLKDDPGKVAHTRFHFTPNLLFRYFTAGYLLSHQTKATVRKETPTVFEYARRVDHGPYAALNVSLFGGVLKFGGMGIFLNRKEAIGSAPADETLELTDENYNKGQAILFNGGARLTLPVTFLPTLAVVKHNMSDTAFTAQSTTAPESIKSTTDVGLSITPQIGSMVRLHLEANLKDVTGEYADVATSRKVLFGMEFDFARTMFLRLGHGDGFGSVGVGFRSRKVEFDLTTYAVDASPSGFRGQEDRRFVISISSGF
jgi:hypothetical protein